MRTTFDRFVSKVRVDSATGCWLWTGFIGPVGYGDFTFNGQSRRSHRISYQTFVGPIPEGLQIDHLCRVRACCNPAHLEAVTPRVNVLRSTATKGMKTGSCATCGSNNGKVYKMSARKNAWVCLDCRNARRRKRRSGDGREQNLARCRAYYAEGSTKNWRAYVTPTPEAEAAQ